MKFKPNPLLYGANEDFFSTFRLAIRLRDTIDYDLLYHAVEKVMAHYAKKSVLGKTFGISYVGKMDWCGLERYVEDLHAYIGEKHTRNMLLIEVMTVGEDFSLTFMQSGKGNKYLNAFMNEIRSLDIPVSLVGEERYNLCNTNLSME